MKNIIKFKVVSPSGEITIDNYNPEFKELETKEFFDIYLPYTKLFEHITVKNFISIPADLLSRLTNQYLHGAEIQFVTPSRKFDCTYRIHHPKKFYSYEWEPLDLSAPVPRSLAYFEFVYQGKRTTYLNAIRSLSSTKFLPNDIWNALDIYSKQQIDKCREFNKGDYDCAEQWYKDLMKDCISHKIKMYSPNKKTYYEVIAEIDFEKSKVFLAPDEQPLTQKQLSFLYKYAPAYGVEIPTFNWRINSRKTEHGYTEEIERVYANGMSSEEWSKIIPDSRNYNKNEYFLPKSVRNNLKVQSVENPKLLLDAYKQLNWIIDNLKDDGLMSGYARCPECGEIYRESHGCECGACKPIEFLSADNLLYGITSTYEDYESTKDGYDLTDEDTEDLLV